MNRAILYLRSSKDRADVSIDAQRRELQALATSKQLAIVGEYSDAVESAKDEDRPGFQKLLREIRAPGRKWNYLLAVDTSRLSRARHFATIFKHECKKLGIAILYSKMPQADPVMDELLEGIMEVIDQFHSRMSKAKGLAGMRENVSKGHRAGGRAPFGYRLAHETTGATRDGAPVLKSHLEPTEDAPRIAAYLRDRAAGVDRARARDKAQLELAVTTLIGIEWNALTYAGHTVWNVHAERMDGGYLGGRKRRPRAEWVIQHGTHAAMISDDEAEKVLCRLTDGARTRAKRGAHIYLLAGILRAPGGAAWHGDGGRYRLGKGRKIAADRIEAAVLEALAQALQADQVVDELRRRIQALYVDDIETDELKALDKAIAELSRNIERVSALLVETTAPQALLRSIEGWEANRTELLDRRLQLDARIAAADRMRSVRPADVRRLLKHLAEELTARDRASLKDAITRLVEAVELDPESYRCTMRFRIDPLQRGDKLASPRVSELIPPIVLERSLQVQPNRPWKRAA
jgi:site-specific DNA recombinase